MSGCTRFRGHKDRCGVCGMPRAQHTTSGSTPVAAPSVAPTALRIFEVTHESWSRGAVHYAYVLAADADGAKAVARRTCGHGLGLDAFEPKVRLLDDDPVLVVGADGLTSTKTVARVCADHGVRQ